MLTQYMYILQYRESSSTVNESLYFVTQQVSVILPLVSLSFAKETLSVEQALLFAAQHGAAVSY